MLFTVKIKGGQRYLSSTPLAEPHFKLSETLLLNWWSKYNITLSMLQMPSCTVVASFNSHAERTPVTLQGTWWHKNMMACSTSGIGFLESRSWSSFIDLPQKTCAEATANSAGKSLPPQVNNWITESPDNPTRRAVSFPRSLSKVDESVPKLFSPIIFLFCLFVCPGAVPRQPRQITFFEIREP